MRRAEFRSVEDVENIQSLVLQALNIGASDEAESTTCESVHKAYSLQTVGSLHEYKMTRCFTVSFLFNFVFFFQHYPNRMSLITPTNKITNEQIKNTVKSSLEKMREKKQSPKHLSQKNQRKDSLKLTTIYKNKKVVHF